jgi:hypothetical protein
MIEIFLGLSLMLVSIGLTSGIFLFVSSLFLGDDELREYASKFITIGVINE